MASVDGPGFTTASQPSDSVDRVSDDGVEGAGVLVA